MTKLRVAFRNFVNAPKIVKKKLVKIRFLNSISIYNYGFYVNVDISEQEAEGGVASALSVHMSSSVGSSEIHVPNVTETHLFSRPKAQLNAHATFWSKNNKSKAFHISSTEFL
jgi:hypothetical protein